jgi:predicted nucleic acid-binding protein
MKYVLDASVGIKWVMNEVDSDKARRIRDDFRNSILELLAPDCYVIESAHGLTKAERRGFVTDSGKLWDELMLDCPDLYHSITMSP